MSDAPKLHGAAHGLWVRATVVAASTLHLACQQPDSQAGPDARLTFDTLTVVEDLRLDGYAADLVPVNGVAARAGVVAVLQSQDHGIRFFDAQGNDRGIVGRRGQGPGEFMSVVRAGWSGDTLWASDLQLQRITLVAPGGEIVRTLPVIAGAVPAPDSRDVLPDFPFVTPYAVYPGDTILALAQWSAGDPKGDQFTNAPLLRISSDGVVQDVVMELPADEGSVIIPMEDGGVAGGRVPYFARPVWAVAPDGRRIVTVLAALIGENAGTFAVHAHDERGGLVWERRIPFEAEPIPAGAGDSAIAATAARQPAGAARAYEAEARSRMPSIYPPVNSVLVGSDSSVWVRLRQTAEGHPWLILSSAGEPLGMVHLPPDANVAAVDDQHVWAVEKDTMDVESLVRYRVSRGQ